MRSTRNDEVDDYSTHLNDDYGESESTGDVVEEDISYHSFTNRRSESHNPRSGREILSSRTRSMSESPPDFRGFGTSITDMFRYSDPDRERIDCCSMACFGCLQADRDRYLTTGIKPPGFVRRVCAHVVMPIVIFGLAIYTAVTVQDKLINQLLCYVFVFTFVFYFISQCLKGAMKRRQVRRNILYAKYQMLTSGRFRRRQIDSGSDDEDDHEHAGGAEGSQDYLMGQTRWDVWNAHAICGCYARDYPLSFAYDDDDKITFCTRIFQCFASACCGTMCGMNLQVCGFCAVAQEGRELESLMQPGKRRIDYVTMQPMMEYYPAIYDARHSPTPNSWWFQRLSKLSQWSIMSCIAWMCLLFVWSMLSFTLKHSFGPKNFVVFCLTLLQAFALLAMVCWNHTKDISIDAVIKFFVCGFCLSTTLGIFFELVVGLIIRFSMALLMAMSGLDIVQENGYSTTTETVSGNMWSSQEVNYGGVNYREYLQVFGNDHPFIFTIYLFITSFILAAFIEELCKYFGYRMVDHPDFHTQAEVEEAMECCEEEDGEHPFATSFSEQNRTYQSRGAAITVAMVAVGLGFACCENLVYIFIYGNSEFEMEVLILIARSLFPIHPIAAALQSIGVCKRDLENNSKVRLGRVILPGIVFHGFYDFAVLWIHYLGNRTGNYFNDNSGVNFSTERGSEKASTIVSAFTLLGGICYYIVESRKQRQRLKGMDGELTDMETRLT
jgi:hypothetical protein